MTLLRPFLEVILTSIEPVFLLIEIYIVMDMIKTFNRWISRKANVRDEEAHDLSTWDPPLATSSIIARTFVILLTISSYVGVYYIINQSKILIDSSGQSVVPLNFNHAIAALVTLQLIAAAATIYKDDGIISESALVCLAASIPILIASWSFNELMSYKQESSR